MGEMPRSEFVPRWARQAKADAHFADLPNTGLQPKRIPTLPTRIFPRGGGSRLSVLSLTDAIVTTQRIASFACHDLIYGAAPDFSDLRSLDPRVQRLSKLSIEPFAQGSFVVPAVLTSEAIEISGRSYSGSDLVAKIFTVLENVRDPQFPASIGLVQAIDDLKKVLKREAEAIEFRGTIGTSTRSTPDLRISIDGEYIERVSHRIKASRAGTSTHLAYESIDGTLIAVDLIRFSFRVVDFGGKEVSGSFDPSMRDVFSRSLDRRVRIEGYLSYQQGVPITIQANSVDLLDD